MGHLIHEVGRILETPLNVMKSPTTPSLTMTLVINILLNLHIFQQCHQKLNIMRFVKMNIMAELLDWIALDYTGVPNKVLRVNKSINT